MKHLANFVRILPLTDFNSFDGSMLISKSGSEPDLFISDKDVVFDPNPGDSRAGTFYTEEVRLVCSKLTAQQRDKYTSRRPVVVLLYDDNGTPILWGNEDQKVRVTLTPNVDNDIIDMVRKTTKALF